MAAVFVSLTPALAQPPVPKTIFRDSDGNLVSNNEFVDIRMANFHYPDRTIVNTLEDGTIEFRLQKIPQEGMPAPDFAFKTLDGKTLTAAELRGKVVVLNFWFIGCAVCRAEKPKLNDLQARFAPDNDVVFIAATADSAVDVKKYIAKEHSTYIQAANAASELEKFVFSGFPKSIVISRTGEIVYWRSTVKAWDKFESVIRSELDKETSDVAERQ